MYILFLKFDSFNCTHIHLTLSKTEIIFFKVSNNIARAATSYQTMLEALAQTTGSDQQTSPHPILLHLVQQVITGWPARFCMD